jgi:hypothetical protein
MHKCRQCLNGLFNNSYWTSEIILAFQQRYKDIGCQVCNVLSRIISGIEQPRKSPRRSGRCPIRFRSRLCHEHKWSATTKNIFFAEKIMAWYSPKCSISWMIAVVLNRPRPEPYLCYQAQAVQTLSTPVSIGLEGPRASLDTVARTKPLCSCWRSNP